MWQKSIAVLLATLFVALPTDGRASDETRTLDTARMSATPGGGPAGGISSTPSISGDGRYVAFHSSARNLVTDKTTTHYDVFVHDRTTGQVERVSISSQGVEGDGQSRNASISDDGRYVAFESSASNFVTDDTNRTVDVFVHDRETDTTISVSTSGAGVVGNGRSSAASISGNGRYVAFASAATNLVDSDSNGAGDIFVRDLVSDSTERVSISEARVQGNNHSNAPSISGDGRYVAFETFSNNLGTSPDTNSLLDVYVHDRHERSTRRVSLGTQGQEGAWPSFGPSISAEGGHVAFTSWAPNLVPSDRNGDFDIFVRDLEVDELERVSLTSSGREDGLQSYFRAISGDGRFVVFQSSAPNLVRGDSNSAPDIFVHDRVTKVTERVSLAWNGEQGNNNSFYPDISRDGRHVAWTSNATNLVQGPNNLTHQVYARTLPPAFTIDDLAVEATESTLRVRGGASLPGRSLVAVEDDDSDASLTAEIGGDLDRAEIVYRPRSNDLLFRIGLAQLPGLRRDGAAGAAYCELDHYSCWPSRAGIPGLAYGVSFLVDDVPYELRARRSASAADVFNPVPVFTLLRCESGCSKVGDIEGGFGTSGDEIRMSLPLDAVNATPGTELIRVVGWSGVDEELTTDERFDEVNVPDIEIPPSTVQVAIAPSGAVEHEVQFDDPVMFAGTFVREVDIADVEAGEHAAWVKVCVSSACLTDALSFTVEPEPIKTRLSLDLAPQRDVVQVAAALTTHEGDPVGGMTIEFFADDERLGSVVTAADGGATKVVGRQYLKPGTIVKAVFVGDRFHSSATAAATYQP